MYGKTTTSSFHLVDDSFQDSISAIKYSIQNNYLAVSSWDGKVTGVNINQKIATEIPEAILDLAWKSDGTGMFCACGDNQARLWDLNANRLTTVAQHQGPVGEVAWCGELPGLFTLSFDGTMAIWDLRQQQPITSLNFMQQANIKPHFFSITYPSMAVACSDMKVCLFNLEVIKSTGQFNPVCLQNNCISMFAQQGVGWVLGSIEGRCEVRNFNLQDPQRCLEDTKMNFTFKAHREKDIYAVNAIAFNPAYGTFVTAGSDGRIALWDKDARVRIKQFPDVKEISVFKYPRDATVPITACAFNVTGELLALSIGYDWSRGASFSGKHSNEVHVRVCQRDEVEKRKPNNKR